LAKKVEMPGDGGLEVVWRWAHPAQGKCNTRVRH